MILDTGSNFLIHTEKNENIVFEYGFFTLSVCNIDFDKTNRCLKQYLKQGANISNAVAQSFNSIYLSWEQTEVLVNMISEEIHNNIEDGIATVDGIIPPLYRFKNYHMHLRKLLLRDSTAFTSDIQRELDSVVISQSIVMLDDGLAVSGYYLNTIEDFLLLDIQKYLFSSHIVKECDYCKRLFIPKRRSDKYCRLPNLEKLTCNELAHRNRNKTDFERIRDKARPEQRASLINVSTIKKYDEIILQDMYQDWSDECGIQFKKFKTNDDLAGFEKWVIRTKYTSERIKKEYAKREKHKNNDNP